MSFTQTYLLLQVKLYGFLVTILARYVLSGMPQCSHLGLLYSMNSSTISFMSCMFPVYFELVDDLKLLIIINNTTDTKNHMELSIIKCTQISLSLKESFHTYILTTSAFIAYKWFGPSSI